MLRPRTGLGIGWGDVARVVFPVPYIANKLALSAGSKTAPASSLAPSPVPTTSVLPPITVPTSPILYIGLAAAAAGLLVYMMKGSGDA